MRGGRCKPNGHLEHRCNPRKNSTKNELFDFFCFFSKPFEVAWDWMNPTSLKDRVQEASGANVLNFGTCMAQLTQIAFVQSRSKAE
eukprot:6224925-Amphidinium_carterae.1